MMISEYVMTHTHRGECRCGQCVDRGERPKPTGHTADLVFFKVASALSPTKEEFVRLTKEHRGELGPCDPLDGADHNYMEIGGWIGDQGLAMRYMGLGAILGVFNLVTPEMIMGDCPSDLRLQAAQNGVLMVIAKEAKAVA